MKFTQDCIENVPKIASTLVLGAFKETLDGICTAGSKEHGVYDKAIGCMNSVGAKLNSCWRTFRGHLQKAVVKAPITGVLPHTCCAYHDLVSCADQSLTPCESTGGKELSVGVLERAFGDAVNLVCGEHTKGSEACKALPKLPALGASDRKIDNYIELLAEAAVTFGRQN